jgi:glycosyltransferase involved in cell wall biosynthesis
MSLAVKTLAVIPAFNEAATLAGVVDDLREHLPEVTILVVDDASTDGTGDLLPRLGVRWLQLTQHLGLGCAMRVGLRYGRMLGFDCALRLDGDGQHVAGEAERLLEVVSGGADAAVGSRFVEPSGYRSPPLRKLVHRLLAFGLSRVTGRRVTDPTSGFWAFGPRALKILGDHYPHGYSEPELLLFLCRNQLSVTEVAVTMRERQGGRSTLTLPRAGLAVARTALAMVIVPRRATVDRGGRA